MCAVFERDYNPGSLNIEDADYNVVQNSGTSPFHEPKFFGINSK
jgi:hypothetical protein